jgi:hypothetical protein
MEFVQSLFLAGLDSPHSLSLSQRVSGSYWFDRLSAEKNDRGSKEGQPPAVNSTAHLLTVIQSTAALSQSIKMTCFRSLSFAPKPGRVRVTKGPCDAQQTIMPGRFPPTGVLMGRRDRDKGVELLTAGRILRPVRVKSPLRQVVSHGAGNTPVGIARFWSIDALPGLDLDPVHAARGDGLSRGTAIGHDFLKGLQAREAARWKDCISIYLFSVAPCEFEAQRCTCRGLDEILRKTPCAVFIAMGQLAIRVLWSHAIYCVMSFQLEEMFNLL